MEIEIENLEEQKSNLEKELGDESIFSNPEKAKETNQNYEDVKVKLDKSLLKWEELSENLENIENEFS